MIRIVIALTACVAAVSAGLLPYSYGSAYPYSYGHGYGYSTHTSYVAPVIKAAPIVPVIKPLATSYANTVKVHHKSIPIVAHTPIVKVAAPIVYKAPLVAHDPWASYPSYSDWTYGGWPSAYSGYGYGSYGHW